MEFRVTTETLASSSATSTTSMGLERNFQWGHDRCTIHMHLEQMDCLDAGAAHLTDASAAALHQLQQAQLKKSSQHSMRHLPCGHVQYSYPFPADVLHAEVMQWADEAYWKMSFGRKKEKTLRWFNHQEFIDAARQRVAAETQGPPGLGQRSVRRQAVARDVAQATAEQRLAHALAHAQGSGAGFSDGIAQHTLRLATSSPGPSGGADAVDGLDGGHKFGAIIHL